MNIHRYLIAIICCLTLSGCGTFLSVGETTTHETDPGGIAVNKRVIYDTEVTVIGNKNDSVNIKPQTGTMAGIDKNKVLVINGTRLPFSSGHLEVTLTEEQLTSKVGITSETGAVRAAEAANTIVDTSNQLTN